MRSLKSRYIEAREAHARLLRLYGPNAVRTKAAWDELSSITAQILDRNNKRRKAA